MTVHLPTIKQLQYLVSLKQHGHFGRAADACFVTQSTLSAGLRELENLLGITLVEGGDLTVRDRHVFLKTLSGLEPVHVILRRLDGSFVAAFSARGATEEGILEAAEEDRRKLIQAHTNPLGPEAAIVAPVT